MKGKRDDAIKVIGIILASAIVIQVSVVFTDQPSGSQ